MSGDSPVAVITGATGFIANQLARRLASQGWLIRAIVRPSSDLSRFAGMEQHLTAFCYDSTPDSLLAAMADPTPTVVFHAASLFLATHDSPQVTPLIESNILFGAHLLEAMSRCSATRIVNTGTQWQHYQDSPYNPVCLYAATKQAFESILTFYLQTAGFSAVTLRLFDVYGPGDTRPKLFNLLRRASQSSTPLAMSPGAQLLDLVYVDDVVDAYVMAAQLIEAATPGVHAIYGVSSGSPISLREVVDIYGEVIHTKIPIQWGLRPYRDREVMIPWRQSIPVPGWAPRVSLRDGIRRMEGCG